MAKKSKKYTDALEKVDRHQEYDVKEAIELAKELDSANFDASLDIAYNLSIDTRQADQNLRGAFVLPNGTGNTQTVAVFAKGDKAEEAKAAGADFVGDSDLVEKVQGGWLDFDVAVATPDMMAEVGRLGQILGPKGMMPNPKTGTVTQDITQAVSDIKAGQIEYRADSAGNIHLTLGKVSFSNEDLLENLQAVHDLILRIKPASIRGGDYIKNVAISTTFGPGIKLDQGTILA